MTDTGIDPRVMSRQFTDGTPAAAEATLLDRRRPGPGADVSVGPWPPPSRGPLPPPDGLPPDLNVFTAQDEIDAWAHEHDTATELLAQLRRRLAGGPDDEGVEIRYLRERSRARRRARANPTERGRRTSQDIDEEVNEALIESGALQAKLDVEASIEIALARLFRARDNATRLQAYIRSLVQVGDGPKR